MNAIYLRVSSKDGRQDESNQEPACLRICDARGWLEPVIYRERESGAKRRPEWERLKESCRRGEVQAVVIWALDRVGRNRVQVAHDIAELARWGVAVISVQDAWIDQPVGPLRDLLLQFMAWVAEGERTRLIERTKAGQARARAQGKLIGRPGVPRDAVDRVLQLWRGGAKASRIAEQVLIPRRGGGLKKIGVTTVRDIVAKNGAPRAPGQPTQIRGL